MADLPDFWESSVVNIITQDLAEIINRPKYGGARLLYGQEACPLNQWTTLFSLSGKGMVYGGLIIDIYAGANLNDSVRYSLDAQTIFSDSFGSLNLYSVTNPLGHPVFLNKYSTADDQYCCSFSYGITFDTSVLVEFFSQVQAKDVGYRFIYALI